MQPRQMERRFACVVLLVALSAGGQQIACGKRYVEGVTPQQAVAYEVDQGVAELRKAQDRVIAAVDANPAIKEKADQFFLDPVRNLLLFTRDKLVPKLDQYDAAIKLKDEAKILSLKTDVRALLNEFNTLALAVTAPQIPPELVEAVGTAKDTVKALIDDLRAEFGEPNA